MLDQLIITKNDDEAPRIWAAVELDRLPPMVRALLLILAADAPPASVDGDGDRVSTSADLPGTDGLVPWKTKAFIEQHLPASARANPGTRKPNAVRMLVKRLRDQFAKRGLSKRFIECESGNTMEDSVARLRVRRTGTCKASGAESKRCDDSKCA